MTVAIYPGSFDPVTNGHLEIAFRAAKLFEKLIIGVFATPSKHLLFSTDERVELVRKSIIHQPSIQVEAFTGLTVEFARKVNAQVVVRGLRAGSDFEREFDMAMMNKQLYPELELVCLMATLKYEFLSSSLLKEIVAVGGDISEFVPPHVAEALWKKTKTLRESLKSI